jgi:hypothetical protein
VAADGVTLGFALSCFCDLGCCRFRHMIAKGAGHDHFGFIAAVRALANLFKLLFCHCGLLAEDEIILFPLFIDNRHH